jgi:hypothetical protein
MSVSLLLALIVGIPLLVIGAVTGFWVRMWPVMLSITSLFVHGHRRPQ